jgi:hypothetical protein
MVRPFGGRARMVPRTLCIVAVLGGALAGQASADAPTWAAPVLVDHAPPFSATHVVTAVSCASETLCVAVDRDGNAVTTQDPTAAAPTWSLPVPTDPDTNRAMAAVSCPSTSLCVGLEDLERIVTTKNPTAATPTWSASVVDPLIVGPAPDQLDAISCPTTSLCVAVTSGGLALISTNPGAETPTWTISPAPIDPLALNSVSCPSASLCVAVDTEGGVSITTDPTSATPTWTATAAVDGANELTSISCQSTALCVAVDSAGNAVTSTNPTAGTPTWTVTQAAGHQLNAVSCPSAALCVAVGDGGGLTVSTNPSASIWVQKGNLPTSGNHAGAISCPTATLCEVLESTGVGGATRSTTPGGSSTSWSAATQIDGTNAFTAVACPAETLCVAADDAGHLARTVNPTAVAPVWELSTQADSFVDVSCQSTAFCVAATTDGFVAVSTNPGAPTPTWALGFPALGALAGVSCPTTTFCMAAAKNHFSSVTTTPGQPHDPDNLTPPWSAAAPIPGSGNLTAISCPSVSLCAVVGSDGKVSITTDPGAATPTWSLTAAPLAVSGLSDIACPTTGGCIATDFSANVFLSTDPAASAPTWSAPQSNIGAFVDCTTASLCMTSLGGFTLFSTDPFASPSTWTPQDTGLPSDALVTAVSCSSPHLCAAVDDAGHTVLRVAAPTSTTPPTLSGTAKVSQTLTAADGSWTATPVVTRQWQRCDAGGGSCTAIDGATGNSYTVTSTDIGQTLRVSETAVNGGGSANVSSAATGVVPALPLPAPAPAASPPAGHPLTVVSDANIRARLVRALAPAGAAAKLRTLIKRGGFVSKFVAPSAGRLVLQWYSRPKRHKAKPVLLASGTVKITKASTVKPKLRLTRAGKRLLHASKKLTITGKGSFTRTGKKAVAATRTLTLKH